MRESQSPGAVEQLRHVLRRLRRAPGYTLVAVGLLGLGLGILAATYTVLNQVILRPLPVEDQDRLVVAWTNHTVRGFDHYPVTVPLFEAAQSGGLPALSGVAAVGSHGTSSMVLERPEGPVSVAWSRVLGDFFGVLGVRARLGRTLEGSDDVPAAPRKTAVISEGLWAREYGRSPDVLGSPLRTRRGSYTIVGVMPADFDYPRGAEVWTPTRPDYPDWAAEPPRLELDLVGRLGPGASREAVASQLAALGSLTPGLRETYRGTVPVVRGFRAHVLGELAPILLVLFAGGVLVLLVVTLDLGNMVLVRSVAARTGTAVRQALGMQPRWAMAEAVMEAAALAVLSSGVGALLGHAAVRLVMPMAPGGLGRLDRVGGLDPTAYLVLVGGAFVAAGVAVVLPRWREVRVNLDGGVARDLRHGSSPGGRLVREVLVAGQVAVAVWVLVVGTLMVRTVVNLGSLDPGFEPERLGVVQLDRTAETMMAEPGEAAQVAAAVARIEEHPAVQAATPVQMAPLPGNAAWQTILFKEGQPHEEALEDNGYLFMEFVEPDFASILGVPVLAGRLFTDADGPAAPGVLVVNQSAARLYWPGGEAVGQEVEAGLPGMEGAALTVIGVVGDTRYGDLVELKPTVYFPYRQTGMFGVQHLLVRSTGPDAPILQVTRAALEAEAPRYRAVGVSSVRSRLAEPLARPRFAAVLLVLLASTALLIAFAGVHSTMAVLVRSRQRELGVRMACGGTPGHVGGLVVRRGLAIALAGAVAGASLAAVSSGLLRSLLFGVAPGDPASLLVGVGLALAFSAIACLAPALRAASTEPAVVLRAD